MNEADGKRAGERWRRAASMALLAVVAVNLAALAVRVWFVVVSGPYASTTGGEEFCLYNLWKVLHGLPLYEWPQREPYLLTLYNAGFYYVYAGWAWLWQADGATMVGCVRGLTTCFALAGMLVNVHLLRRLAPGDGGRRGWAWGLSFLVWFGTSYQAWSTVTARVDMGAGALALAGFAAALRAGELRRDRWWLASSLLFVGAWSFKQSVVWIFAGTVLHLLARRRWREGALLVVPFAVAVGGGLWASSDVYRYNVLTVPRLMAWLPQQSVGLLVQVVALNAFFCLFGAIAIGGVVRRWRQGRGTPDAPEPRPDRWEATAVAAIPAVGLGVGQLSFRGSSTNNLLEGFLLVALLGGGWWLRRWNDGPPTRGMKLGLGLLLGMGVLPVVQLVLAARGIPYATVREISVGNLTKLNTAQLAQRRAFAAWLATLPKPLWIRDGMLQLPWFATDDRYPAFLLNPDWEADAADRGVLLDRGFASLIRQRHFACLLLQPDDRLLRVAREAGYVEAPVPAEFAVLASEFGLNLPGPRLWLRR